MPNKKTSPRRRLARRDFLKFAGVATGGALAGSAFTETGPSASTLSVKP